MGMIVDRTKSKWGKMRPYLLFAPVPIAICTVLLFTAPFEEGSTAAILAFLIKQNEKRCIVDRFNQTRYTIK